MPWERRAFEGREVWVLVNEQGKPLVENNRVRMKHDQEQSEYYQASPDNITPFPRDYHEQNPITDDRIEIYTDGSSTDASQQGGPTGVGIVLRSKEDYREINEPADTGNNITAELDAIYRGLKAIKDTSRPTRLYTDSEYAINALTEWIHNWRKNGWKTSGGDPVSYQERLRTISELMDQFEDLEFTWVEGHAGHLFNERADWLANRAAEAETTS